MSSLAETTRRGIRVVGTLAVTLLALSACGAVDTPTENSTGEAGSPRSPSTTHSSGSSVSPKSPGHGEDPFNLTAGDWPRDLRGADALYDKMPPKFGKTPRAHPVPMPTRRNRQARWRV